MRVIGIVAEFNPFHNGHEYLIKKAREIVNDPRAIVMPIISGFFTQRGLPAICPPQVRARQALLCGADVVIELPFSFSAAPSSRFAEGAISELVSTGVVTDLAFGVDVDDTDLLMKLAQIDQTSDQFNMSLNELISTGISFPQARAEAIKSAAKAKGIDGDLDTLLSSPNSILALDYLLALKKIDKRNRINIIMIKREGDAFSSMEAESSFASATTIRKLISDTASDNFSRSLIASKLTGLMPDISLGVMLSKNSDGAFSFPNYVDYMRTCITTVNSSSDIEKVAYMTDDLSGYLKNFAGDIRPGTISDTDFALKDFEKKLSTKRYTLSRIYRALASMMAGQDNSYLNIKRPPYIRVLGFNSDGKYCLKVMGKCAKAPIINRPSDCLELQSGNDDIKKIFELDMRASAIGWKLYGKDIASEWESIPVIVK